MKKRISYSCLKTYLFTALEVLAISLLFFQSTAFKPSFLPGKTYRIGERSVLKLEGKTNVNDFTCRCTEMLPTQTYYLEKLDDGKCTTVFRETSLQMKVKSLDCGNKLMNKDMYDALNYKAFPHIKIELVKVSENKCNRLTEQKDWVQVTSLVKITLNGKTNEYSLNVAAQKTASNLYRFIGQKTLCMSDFGITPPVAVMGMVKVKDEIMISLDLEVTVE